MASGLMGCAKRAKPSGRSDGGVDPSVVPVATKASRASPSLAISRSIRGLFRSARARCIAVHLTSRRPSGSPRSGRQVGSTGRNRDRSGTGAAGAAAGRSRSIRRMALALERTYTIIPTIRTPLFRPNPVNIRSKASAIRRSDRRRHEPGPPGGEAARAGLPDPRVLRGDALARWRWSGRPGRPGRGRYVEGDRNGRLLVGLDLPGRHDKASFSVQTNPKPGGHGGPKASGHSGNWLRGAWQRSSSVVPSRERSGVASSHPRDPRQLPPSRAGNLKVACESYYSGQVPDCQSMLLTIGERVGRLAGPAPLLVPGRRSVLRGFSRCLVRQL